MNASAGNVDTNGDVVDVLLERLQRAIDPDAPAAERAALAARLVADVARRRAAALPRAFAGGWVPGGAG